MTEEQREIFKRSASDVAMHATPEMIAEEMRKEARLKAEREAIEERVRENREKFAKEKRENAERDFKSRCETIFFKENPNAEKRDFLRLYDKIRDRVMLENTIIGLTKKDGVSSMGDFS